MKSTVFNRKLLKSLRYRKDIVLTQHDLYYENASFKFLKIVSKNIRPTDKVILISAGLHGEEIAGPITLLKYLSMIIDYIHANNLRVIIYPNINPFGFEDGVRCNIDSDYDNNVGDPNDFLRYSLWDGTITDDLKEKNDYKEWFWSSDEMLNLSLLAETKLMHILLRKDPLSQVIAAIDLHQDYITQNVSAAAYQYLYGDFSVYSSILQRIGRIVPLLSNSYIDAGYSNGGLMSDAYGCLIRYDGSLSDLMQRMGVRYSVTVETTGATPLNKACEVNLTWILGITDLIRNRV